MGSFDSLSSAISGLQAQSVALQYISNNVSNAQTTAYKVTDTNFQDVLDSQFAGIQANDGVQAVSKTDTRQGAIESSTVGTFMAINGVGYFAVERPTTTDSAGRPSFAGASPAYTRRGDFDTNGDGYLVNGTGDYLMGTSLDPATGAPTGGTHLLRFNSASLPADQGALQNLSVSASGKIQGTFASGNTIDLAGIPLASFAGEQSLGSEDAGTFIPTPQSGAARANAPGQIVANALEASNTDISAQFSTMIQTQQAYTANTKVVTASNEMLQTLTSMIL